VNAGSKAGAIGANSSSSKSSNTTTIVAAIAGAALLVVMGAVGYRAVLSSKDKSNQDATATYTSLETPQTTLSGGYHASKDFSNEYLDNDIRNDKALSLYRIDSSAIQLGDPIARGGFGVIYRGVFDGQLVAIKQMLPSTCRDEARVRGFMEEIRLCVSLDHPKIVRCVGISWTSLRDLSVVIEFMDGGDLHSVLHSQHGDPTGSEWSEPWTASNLSSKAAIASDIAEAVVYLHSFNAPIIHRDLKAKNVLLDSKGNAKLSDFGVSREVPMDETMTREVGTVAWIAPEVLRGERYSEKADIYSLGVLLVELDRCRHPYSHEDVLAAADEMDSRGRSRARPGAASQAMLKNTRIAILVSTGKLRPTVSPSCPDGVRRLVDRCLLPDPTDRPNAMEIHHELRQFRRGLT
jgi:serine/threonine protein kinase